MRSSHGSHKHVAQARILRDARAEFLQVRGPDEYFHRAAEINELPSVVFKGRDLKTLRCNGVRGKGPHDCNVPESLLWVLISLKHFCCVFHHGDQLTDRTDGA